MNTKFSIGIPYKPGSIESPSFPDVLNVFENRNSYGGALHDVSLVCSELGAQDIRVYRKLWFWLESEDCVASFYEADGLWGFVGGNEAGDNFLVDDGGGEEVQVNSKFLHPKAVALEFCREFLENGAVSTGIGWEAIT